MAGRANVRRSPRWMVLTALVVLAYAAGHPGSPAGSGALVHAAPAPASWWRNLFSGGSDDESQKPAAAPASDEGSAVGKPLAFDPHDQRSHQQVSFGAPASWKKVVPTPASSVSDAGSPRMAVPTPLAQQAAEGSTTRLHTRAILGDALGAASDTVRNAANSVGQVLGVTKAGATKEPQQQQNDHQQQQQQQTGQSQNRQGGEQTQPKVNVPPPQIVQNPAPVANKPADLPPAEKPVVHQPAPIVDRTTRREPVVPVGRDINTARANKEGETLSAVEPRATKTTAPPSQETQVIVQPDVKPGLPNTGGANTGDANTLPDVLTPVTNPVKGAVSPVVGTVSDKVKPEVKPVDDIDLIDNDKKGTKDADVPTDQNTRQTTNPVIVDRSGDSTIDVPPKDVNVVPGLVPPVKVTPVVNPVVDADAGAKKGKNEPVVDAGKAKDEPVIDTGKTTNVPVVDTGKATNEPVVDTGKATNEPVVDTGKATNEPVIDPGKVLPPVVGTPVTQPQPGGNTGNDNKGSDATKTKPAPPTTVTNPPVISTPTDVLPGLPIGGNNQPPPLKDPSNNVPPVLPPKDGVTDLPPSPVVPKPNPDDSKDKPKLPTVGGDPTQLPTGDQGRKPTDPTGEQDKKPKEPVLPLPPKEPAVPLPVPQVPGPTNQNSNQNSGGQAKDANLPNLPLPGAPAPNLPLPGAPAPTLPGLQPDVSQGLSPNTEIPNKDATKDDDKSKDISPEEQSKRDAFKPGTASDNTRPDIVMGAPNAVANTSGGPKKGVFDGAISGSVNQSDAMAATSGSSQITTAAAFGGSLTVGVIVVAAAMAVAFRSRRKAVEKAEAAQHQPPMSPGSSAGGAGARSATPVLGAMPYAMPLPDAAGGPHVSELDSAYAQGPGSPYSFEAAPVSPSAHAPAHHAVNVHAEGTGQHIVSPRIAQPYVSPRIAQPLNARTQQHPRNAAQDNGRSYFEL